MGITLKEKGNSNKRFRLWFDGLSQSNLIRYVLYFIIISMNCFRRKCRQTNSYIFSTIFIRSTILYALIFIYNNCFASMYFKFV